jgi:hypothetical protein
MAIPHNSDLHRRPPLSTRVLSLAEQLACLELGADLPDLALNPSLDASVQGVLAREGSPESKEALVRNESLTAEAQAHLALHAGTNARVMLSMRPDLTPEVQHSLARDAEWMVRCGLAASEGLTAEVIELLQGDRVVRVRHALAQRRDLAPGTAKALGADEDRGVRNRVATNYAVELDASFALACLELSERGRVLVEAALAEEGLDTEALSVLRSGWSGTLEELLITVQDFAPNQP